MCPLYSRRAIDHKQVTKIKYTTDTPYQHLIWRSMCSCKLLDIVIDIEIMTICVYVLATCYVFTRIKLIVEQRIKHTYSTISNIWCSKSRLRYGCPLETQECWNRCSTIQQKCNHQMQALAEFPSHFVYV